MLLKDELVNPIQDSSMSSSRSETPSAVDSTTPPVSFSRQEKVLLAIMAGLNFCHILDFMIIMPLGPRLIRQFSIDSHQFGLLVSSYTFMAGLSGLLASFFIDRFDRKTALLFFATGFTVGTLACAGAWSYQSFLVTRSLTGMFGGVLASVILSSVSDTFAYERRGTAMGVVMGSFSVASVVGIPLALELVKFYGWHAPFVFVGTLSLVVLTVLFWAMPPMKEHLAGGTKRYLFDSFIHIANAPSQKIALVFMFSLILGQFSVIPYLSQSFVMNAGLPEDELSLVYLCGGLCSMVAAPVAGRLSDRFTKHLVFQGAILFSIVLIFFITHLSVGPVWWTLFLSSLFFIAMSGRMVPATALISSTARPKHRGGFMSVVSSVQQFSAALASYVAGIIIVENNGRLEQYETVGYIAIVFSIFALFLSKKIPHGQQ